MKGGRTDAEALFLKGKALADAFKDNAKRQRNFLLRADAGLTGVAESREQWELAQKYLKDWLELDPESAPAHQHLGRTYFKLSSGDKSYDKEAYEEFQAAAKLDTQLTNPDIMMGNMYEESKNLRKQPNSSRRPSRRIRKISR